MKFQAGQRVQFRSATSDRMFKGEVIRPLKDGFYLVTDGTGLPPRHIHGNRLGAIPRPQYEQIFA